MITWIQKKLPYRGFTNWVALCSVFFIVSQLMWHFARAFRRWDFLEMPMAIFFFPLAPLFEPYDGMVNSRHVFLYALPYWLLVFVISLAVSRKRINPLVPALLLLVVSAVVSIVYSVFFVYHGPVP